MNQRKRRVRKSQREKLTQNCGQLNDDDCIDPRDYFQSKTRSLKPDRKALQLCRQVEQTLSLILADSGSAEMLELLSVVSVIPAPDASRLLVTLCPDETEHYDPAQAQRELTEHRGRLRCEVASSISRKRAPLLQYNLLPPSFRESFNGGKDEA